MVPRVALSRSEQMRQIKGANTRPEIALRKALWHRGHRFRVDYKTQYGRPDIAFPKMRVAVFVDGCFWHGCPLHYVRPRARSEFWSAKLTSNLERDRRATRGLLSLGWTVIRFLEHEVEDLERCCSLIEACLNGAARARPARRVALVEVVDAIEDTERRTIVDLLDDDVRETVEGRRVSRSGKAAVRRPSGSVAQSAKRTS